MNRDWIFTDENLALDTFLRSYMDEQGFVPLSLVFSYQNVACFSVPPSNVIDKLQRNNKFELDLEVGTIKLKERWNLVNSNAYTIKYSLSPLLNLKKRKHFSSLFLFFLSPLIFSLSFHLKMTLSSG